MEGQLLDLGFDAPAPTAQQQTQAEFDPFGVPQTQTKPQEPAAAVTDTTQAASQPTQPSSISEPQLQLPPPQQQPQTPTATAEAATVPAPDAAATGSDSTTAPSFAQVEAEVANGGPLTPAEEQQKAKLKEIQQIFGGKWRLIRGDPFAEYLKATGVGLVTRNRVRSGTNDVDIGVLDGFIYVNASSMLHRQISKLKLDEALENVIMGTNHSVFCSYQDQKLELQMTPLEDAWGKMQSLQYSINEQGELMAIYTFGSHVCRRCFAKVIIITN